jgi:hypothetical protein
VPTIVKLRLDPYEKMAFPEDLTKNGSPLFFSHWYLYPFRRFVFVQQVMGKEIQTFLEFPPMQWGASFNRDARKAEMAAKMAQGEAASKGHSNQRQLGSLTVGGSQGPPAGSSTCFELVVFLCLKNIGNTDRARSARGLGLQRRGSRVPSRF